jgi:hypothetical protein
MIKGAPSPEGLARKTLQAVRRNRALVRYGFDAYGMSLLRVLPLWLVDPLGRLLGRTALTVVENSTFKLSPAAEAHAKDQEPTAADSVKLG